MISFQLNMSGFCRFDRFLNEKFDKKNIMPGHEINYILFDLNAIYVVITTSLPI